MPISIPRLSLLVLVAAAITAGVLMLVNRDPSQPLVPHIALAPPPQSHAPRAHGTVFGTTESAQQTANEAVENSIGPNGLRPDLHPLPPRAFNGPIAAYRVYAVGQAHRLAADVDTLTGALRADDRGASERAWSAAYSDYMRIGAAYGALGDLDTAIDGRDQGLHRVEHGLWTGRAPASLVPVARTLQADVAHVPHALLTGEITPLDYATRAHEILEDAQRDQVSGVLPHWSDAGVLALYADWQATNEVLNTLNGVLSGRGDALAQSRSRLAQLGTMLAAIRRAHHGWPATGTLTQREHEDLTGTLGATLEALSGVPGSLETFNPPPYPKLPPAKGKGKS